MGILYIVGILIVWAIIGAKESLTPPKPAIKSEDINAHLNKVLSFKTVKERQDYLKKM